MAESAAWLNYDEAAVRVRSDPRTIRNWRRAGMPMGWRLGRHGQQERVVQLDVLLSWWRQKLLSNPVHANRMRNRAREAGAPEPVIMTRRQSLLTPGLPDASTAVDGSEGRGLTPRAGDERTEVETSVPARAVDPLADMRPLRGGPEYFVLVEAMRDIAPGCSGIEQFTADRLDEDEARMLATICTACPLLEQCRAFATASRPTSGYWAGVTWRKLTASVAEASVA